MEASKISEADNLDDSVYSDADLTYHLRDKIRQQAARLRGLDQYRVICEKRIQELSPGHPLPVKEDQRSAVLSVHQELQLARDKIQRLESHLSHHTLEVEEAKDQENYVLLLEKYNDMLKDKTDLEESLRAEMLNCEEQRTYIELLKQTIEGKLEEMDGISFDPRAMPVINNSRLKIDDSRREQSRMRNTILDYESQIKRLSHRLKTRENENEMLVKEREELDMHLRQAAEALQIAEEEVSKLEEEKNSMVEYLNQSTSKEREMERELNDLSKYFEEMKKDFHETLKTLEIIKNKESKQQAENEVHKEEIFRTSQQYSDIKNLMDTLKMNLQDKETALRIVKEDKMNAELKIEKLQANVLSLTESLKEAQTNASRIQEQLDSYSRKEAHKSQNLTRLQSEHMNLYQENSIFKEKFQILTKELDNSKKALNELERIRELDIKQLQDFKSKLLDYQVKNEIFEGFQKNRSDNKQARRSDQSRILQLEEEIQYLTESIHELQHKENNLSQNFNEAKSLNLKLSNQIEELYLENDSYRYKLDKKTKEADLYISKFNNLNEYYESIETDKSEMQDLLKTERLTLKLIKDQLEVEKIKYEELKKEMSDIERHKSKFEKSSQEKDEEVKQLKISLKNLEHDFEDERNVKNKLNIESKENFSKTEILEKELEKLYLETANCCKIISAFCGKLTITYNDYRSCLTPGYKEFLDNWTEGNKSSIESITSWVMNTIEEIQSLSKSLFKTSKQFKQASNEISKFQTIIDDSNTNETIYKQHAKKLKNELEELYRKNEVIIEDSEQEIHNLRYEITSLKHEIMSLTSDRFSLSEALKSALTESNSMKMMNDYPTMGSREKVVYSKEELMKQVQRDIAISKEDISRVDLDREKVRKSMICEKDHSPSTCPYLHLNTPNRVNLRHKAQFS